MLRPLNQYLAILLAGSATAIPHVAIAQSSAASYTYSSRYNEDNQLTGQISPDPDGVGAQEYRAVRNTYDGVGRLIKVEAGELTSWQPESVAPSAWGGVFIVNSVIETSYDDSDRKVKEIIRGTDGVVTSITEYSYTAVGGLECTAIRMNPAIYDNLPTSACILGASGVWGPDRITKNVYDPTGRLIQIRWAVGTSLEEAYATYTYTPNGKQEYVIDANGNRAKMEYDGFDRLNKWIFPSQTKPASYAPSDQATALVQAGAINSADYEAYGYDANDNRTSLRKRDGSILTYTYDALNRLSSKVVPERSGLGSTHTRDVYYGYDARGLQTYARFDSSSGEGLTNVYDGFGRLTSATEAMDGQSRQLSYIYDADGNRTRITWPDGAYMTMGFDGMDRQSSLSDSAGAVLDTFTYNNRGGLAANTRSGTAFDQSFGYDAVGRLSSASITDGASASQVSWSYGRNPASQITSDVRSNDAYAWNGYYNIARAYTANGLNQYTAAGAAAFCYDANGNLTADGSSVYLYDVENRLVEKRTQTNTTCSSLSYIGTLQASLRYDPLGHLYEVAGTSTTRLLYDGDALVGEYNTSGLLLRRYAHGNDVGADDPMIWFEGSSALAANARHLYADPRGSIVLTGDASGNPVAINTYDEYGIPGSANQGRFQYTGQAWLAEIGMYYYKARIYSPTLGRFLQTDPIGYDDQINLHTYVRNDPINEVDPSGDDAITQAITVIGQGAAEVSISAGEAILRGLSLASEAPISAIQMLVTASPAGGYNDDCRHCSHILRHNVDDTIDKITQKGDITKDDGHTRNVNMGGGDEGALEDWKSVVKSAESQEKSIPTQYGQGKAVDLPGGGTASLRPGSSDGSTTIQVSNRPGLPVKTVFRYR